MSSVATAEHSPPESRSQHSGWLKVFTVSQSFSLTGRHGSAWHPISEAPVVYCLCLWGRNVHSPTLPLALCVSRSGVKTLTARRIALQRSQTTELGWPGSGSPSGSLWLSNSLVWSIISGGRKGEMTLTWSGHCGMFYYPGLHYLTLIINPLLHLLDFLFVQWTHEKNFVQRGQGKSLQH